MKTVLIVFVLIFSSIGLAGPGHGHGKGHGHGHSHGAQALNEKQAQEAGKFHVTRLIKAEKIDKTWSGAAFDKAEKKKFGKKTEWVVTFNNEKGVKGKKLYIFLKTSGEFVAANFTGK